VAGVVGLELRNASIPAWARAQSYRPGLEPKSKWNLNNIGVRSFVLTGAPFFARVAQSEEARPYSAENATLRSARIEVPIILAPMGTCTSGEFAAAVSNNGGLGGVGSLFRTAAAIKRDIDAVRELTTRPFALNHIPQNLVPEAFDYALAARPAVMSFALADPGDLARQARGVGSRIMIQVTTVAQAVQEWKQAIVAAKSEDVMCAEVLNDIIPLLGTAGFGTVLRSIHTEFLDRWSANREEARRERESLKAEIISTTQAGLGEEQDCQC
jgi:Nitronate monooxygenase